MLTIFIIYLFIIGVSNTMSCIYPLQNCLSNLIQVPQADGHIPILAVTPSLPSHPSPHDFLMLSLVTTIICGILNLISLAFGIPAIIFAILVGLISRSLMHAYTMIRLLLLFISCHTIDTCRVCMQRAVIPRIIHKLRNMARMLSF